MDYSIDVFNRALIFAAKAHGCQKIDGSQIPYIIHPVMVAWEVISFFDYYPEEDPNLLIQAALLHDVLEDTETTRTQLREEFGEDVVFNVVLLSKEILSEKSAKKSVDEYLEALASGPSSAQIIKMADRISNLRLPPATWTQKRISSYLVEAKKILHRLGSANQAMAERLQQKIDQYAQFTGSGQY